jgi:hypothetical protein
MGQERTILLSQLYETINDTGYNYGISSECE